MGGTAWSILTRLPTPLLYFRQALKGMSDSTTMPSSPSPSRSPLLSSDWLNGRPARPKRRPRSEGTIWTAVEEVVRETGSEGETACFWDPHPSKWRRTSASPLRPTLLCRAVSSRGCRAETDSSPRSEPANTQEDEDRYRQGGGGLVVVVGGCHWRCDR